MVKYIFLIGQTPAPLIHKIILNPPIHYPKYEMSGFYVQNLIEPLIWKGNIFQSDLIMGCLSMEWFVKLWIEFSCFLFFSPELGVMPEITQAVDEMDWM